MQGWVRSEHSNRRTIRSTNGKGVRKLVEKYSVSIRSNFAKNAFWWLIYEPKRALNILLGVLKFRKLWSMLFPVGKGILHRRLVLGGGPNAGKEYFLTIFYNSFGSRFSQFIDS